MILYPNSQRSGAVVPLVAVMIVFMLGMIAFGVDIGYIAVTQKEVQNAADAAAMAGTSQLRDRNALKGAPSQSAVVAAARTTAQLFSGKNTGGGVSLQLDANGSNDPAGDIVVGRINNPTNLSDPLDTTPSKKFNSVQARVRRNPAQNGSLKLFFGSVLGRGTQDLAARATATYEDAISGFRIAGSGVTNSKLLPFTLQVNQWTNAPTDPWYDSSLPDGVMQGNGPDDWSYNPTTQAYTNGSDGIHEVKLYPTKGTTPGNFGTVDLGLANNSTSDISRQILYGPNQTDMDAMGGSIALGANGTLVVQGDTGISAGFKDELAAIRGQPRIIPLYTTVVGQGNNTYYTVVGWAGVIITDVQLTTGDKYVTIQPEYVTDGSAKGGGSASSSFFVTKPLRLTR
ncbi:MAG TPA: pilus assembly protein TadG-related protein [Gemmataceae bacterium]|nr:pilus assembly protein TadG-related protein [Gemmataceae bacterium]